MGRTGRGATAWRWLPRTPAPRSATGPPPASRSGVDRRQAGEQRHVGDRCVFGHTSVERELGLEVRFLAMAVRDVLGREDLDEDLDNVAIELRAADAAQLSDRG